MKSFIRAPKAYEMKNEKVFHPTVFPSVEKCCDKVYKIKNPENSGRRPQKLKSDEIDLMHFLSNVFILPPPCLKIT